MQKKEMTKTQNNYSTTKEFKKILSEQTDNCYIEENKLVLFNVVRKNKFEESIEGIRTSIGYILPNNEVYDFVSKNVYEIYELYKSENLKKQGKFALITNVIFKNSTIKYKINEKNLENLEIMLEKHIREYNAGKAQIRHYWSQIEYKPNTGCTKKRYKLLKLND